MNNVHDVYALVTNRIIKQLEAGIIPWKKPWASTGFPKNLISKYEYRGINVFMLASMRYIQPYWLTFKQLKSLGGSVIKGEKACPVVFWKWLEKENDEEEKSEKYPLLRHYWVFNVQQCKGIDKKIPELPVRQKEFEPIEEAKSIVKNMPNPPKFRGEKNQAYYNVKEDVVNIPVELMFGSREEYYCTYFHEISHATGHPDRLARKEVIEKNMFGSADYSKEELVAEMGAAFLCDHAGIFQETLENSAAYIQGWLSKLKNDKKMLLFAASQAQKAADYILNKKERKPKS